MNKGFKNFWIIPAVFSLILSFVINGSNVFSKSFDRNETLFEKSSGKDELSDLTVKIASLSARRKEKNLSEDVRSTDNFAELAKKRYKELSRLIENDPGEVLRVALPEEVLSKIPERDRAFFEKREELEGELEVIAECEENKGRTLYYLNTEKGRFSLYFANQPKDKLPTGARVIVKGVRAGEAIAVGENALQNKSSGLEAAILSDTFGEKKILMLLVNFKDNQSQPFTTAQAYDLVLNPANSYSVTNFYLENSYGQSWLTGDTYGWFTLPINSGDCGGSQIAAYAKQAATEAGVNLSLYDKYVYVFPNMPSCSWSGKATLGGTEAWINSNGLKFAVYSHELGHSFGLSHSRGLNCGTSIIGDNCTSIEYGNMVDMMGRDTGHFHTYQKERLGWINYGSSPSLITVEQSGTYFISPVSTPDSTIPKGLRILKSIDSSGIKTWYYVEARRLIGFDTALSTFYNNNLTNGVIVTMNNESNGQENYMLHMTPETSTWVDAALPINRSFTDSQAGVTITPLSIDDSGAMVSVTFGNTPTPCSPANPGIAITPSATQWIGAGSSVSYTVTIMNNNSSNCTDNSFNVQPTLPSGWSAVVSSPILNINPGSSASTTVQVISPASATDGFYSVEFGASNAASPAYSASVSASCAIYSSLGVSASPGQASYTRTQTATVTAYISANGSPVISANVTFTMTKANGNRVIVSTTSGANGSATFSYKFNKKQDPVGTYLVSVNANMNGVSGSGSTSFAVR